MHLRVKNGTNLALMNALLYEIIQNGWYDEKYVEKHTIGFEDLKRTVEEYPPETAAEICGVDAEEIREAAHLIGNAERLLSTTLQGFYQSHRAPPRPAGLTTYTCFTVYSASPAAASCR